jgi:hypothetical protein
MASIPPMQPVDSVTHGPCAPSSGARMIPGVFDIEGVEFVNQFFKDKADDSNYLKELKTHANDVGVDCVLIMIDAGRVWKPAGVA